MHENAGAETISHLVNKQKIIRELLDDELNSLSHFSTTFACSCLSDVRFCCCSLSRTTNRTCCSLLYVQPLQPPSAGRREYAGGFWEAAE